MAHYRFSNLLGAPYRGGNLCIRGTHLLTSVGNRVNEVDLHMSSSTTLPSENLTDIACIAVSPSGSHMISFDTDGRAILVNLRCARDRTRRAER
jgi:periodic tryptophan protein 2